MRNGDGEVCLLARAEEREGGDGEEDGVAGLVGGRWWEEGVLVGGFGR